MLLLVAATLLATNVWAALDARIAATAASQAAVRAAVTAPPGADLLAVADDAAQVVWRGHGRPVDDLDLRWDGAGPAPVQARCAEISFRVVTRVPAMVVPGASTPAGYDVAASHTERIERHRAGMPAEVCAP